MAGLSDSQSHQTQPHLKSLINVYMCTCIKLEADTTPFLDIEANIKMLTDIQTDRQTDLCKSL